jgi:hypothetical protein
MLEVKREAMSFMERADRDSGDKATITFPIRDGRIIASGLIFNDEDEFTYQGKMYDVISSEKSKDHITFKCYSDNKETELTQNLKDKVDSEKDAPVQKQKGSLLKIWIQYTAASPQHFCFSNHKFVAYTSIYQTTLQPFVYRAIVSPPPEYIVA